MAQMRTLEDFIHARLEVDGRSKLSVFRTVEGRWQANLANRDGSHTCDVGDNPVDVIWNVLVPFQMRRVKLPSGREVAIDEAAAGTVFGLAQPVSDLDDLLGDVSSPQPSVSSDDIEDLLA